MSTQTPHGEASPRGGEGGSRRAGRVNKACIPCRARKVRCDAAAIGAPCSGCTSRRCMEDCVLKISTTPATANDSLVHPSQETRLSSPSDPSGVQSSRGNDHDLHFLNVLSEVDKDPPQRSRDQPTLDPAFQTRSEHGLTPRNCLSNKLKQLDDLDDQYLRQKGVFDLPSEAHLDVFIKAYFEYVYPYRPVISRDGFIHDYQTGDCSLFVLRCILAVASLHAPDDVLHKCGYTSRSAAQESLFVKAKLLHDLAPDDDTLVMLQGSLILGTIILDHATDRDFIYWFHNAIRYANRLDLQGKCVQESRPQPSIKLYRRIWWSLYSMDMFHISTNPKRSRLFEDNPSIRPYDEDDWEADEPSGPSSRVLSPSTSQQRATAVVQTDLCRAVGQCVSIIRAKRDQDPHNMMQPLDAWRHSFTSNVQLYGSTTTDNFFISTQCLSYRFDTVLCRMIRRRLQMSNHSEWTDWIRQRLRSSMLELDTIMMRVLSVGNLHEYPTVFVTTIPLLLALHIEAALDPSETELVRSMSRISISQTMLILDHGKDLPALKRALPVFEHILAKKNLAVTKPNANDMASTPSLVQPPNPEQSTEAGTYYITPHTENNMVSPIVDPFGGDAAFDVDWLGFDFAGDWQVGTTEVF